MTIDWIMETRLSLWEMEYGNYDNNDYYTFVPVESSILTKFQEDLNLLRCLTVDIPVKKLAKLLILNVIDFIFFLIKIECAVTYIPV